jgi:hypothetical protein
MANIKDHKPLLVLLDFVQNPPVANADPPRLRVANNLSRLPWPRGSGQPVDDCAEPLSNGIIKLPQKP